eukprot:TRINITY_DN492_c0_g1_i4.p1 TRINITY_DN492_c0_g1~~TRINITY_DN492_c0_g1_i4.p1  ORF type:complete len:164 (-),score=1.39 TRINITY_DN492_c0_g1_i4:110-601(-)
MMINSADDSIFPKTLLALACALTMVPLVLWTVDLMIVVVIVTSGITIVLTLLVIFIIVKVLNFIFTFLIVFKALDFPAETLKIIAFGFLMFFSILALLLGIEMYLITGDFLKIFTNPFIIQLVALILSDILIVIYISITVPTPSKRVYYPVPLFYYPTIYPWS